MSDDHHLVVLGAGVKGVNGIYFRTGHLLNGQEVYTPSGNFEDRNNGSFFIWYDSRWYISSLSQRNNAYKDVLYWCII